MQKVRITVAKSKSFRLVAKPIPSKRAAFSGFYRQIIEEFMRSGEESALISGTDRKPATLVQSLRKTLSKDGIEDVKVVQRADEVYLSRE